MKTALYLATILVFINACGKEEQLINSCYEGNTMIRKVENERVTVTNQNAQYVLKGTTETYVPCDIPAQYKIDGEQVYISGETVSRPCTMNCMTGIVLTDMHK
jgi:hypothetical protein